MHTLACAEVESLSTPPHNISLHPWYLRPAQEGDFTLLHSNCWQQQADARYTFELAIARQQQQRAATVVAASVSDNEPVAFAQLSRWRSGAEISDLIVMETWRNQGIGRQIIQYLLEIAAQKHIRLVEIGVEKNNLVALRLYRSCGFSENTGRADTEPVSHQSMVYLWLHLRA